ncbi:MAG TPA: isocitrate lyase/phosphoenolpyruvate mutase family protein [Longimicrobiaceae bacterium]|nr:isocitrate lyase/phosphoenolpyruvate mutase family protein [Longimicrobiaceae bacterium]
MNTTERPAAEGLASPALPAEAIRIADVGARPAPGPLQSLRVALSTGTCLSVGGAFDGLSARLVERAGYDAVWAGGFSISASLGLPDLNVMSTTELVERVGEMVDGTSVPVIVDCDEGYGSLPTTRRLVRHLVDRGAQGICIEDNVYPKSNSFCEERRNSLVPIDHFRRKLDAVHQAAPEAVVIARTESLIQGEPLEKAVRRGRAYADSGADLVLLHSKYGRLDEYERMVAAWDGPSPLIVIPTLAPEVRFSNLAELGFRMVIYANQALRASVQSMEEVLCVLRTTGDPAQVASRLVSMNHVFDLTGLTAADR